MAQPTPSLQDLANMPYYKVRKYLSKEERKALESRPDHCQIGLVRLRIFLLLAATITVGVVVSFYVSTALTAGIATAAAGLVVRWSSDIHTEKKLRKKLPYWAYRMTPEEVQEELRRMDQEEAQNQNV